MKEIKYKYKFIAFIVIFRSKLYYGKYYYYSDSHKFFTQVSFWVNFENQIETKPFSLEVYRVRLQEEKFY